jgi:potassium efflux system protein
MQSLSKIILFFGLVFALSLSAFAQETSAPTVTASSIDARIEALNENSELTEEQVSAASELLLTAKQRLQDRVLEKEQLAQYESDIETAPETLADLREEIEAAELALDVDPEVSMELQDAEAMREDDLLALEQELTRRESELRALRAEVEGYRAGLQALSARQVNAPRELTEARTELGRITTSLTDLGEGASDAVGTARRINLRVRSDFRRSQIAALEQEIEGLPRRIEIITARQTLADLKTRKLSLEVQALQERTGQRRLNEALQLQDTIRGQAELYADQHPVLTQLAQRNNALAEQIRDLAASEFGISRDTAAARSQHDNVLEDLNTANKLIELESLDRNVGATLRRLGSRLTSPQAINADLVQTQRDLVSANGQTLIAQESLRDLPLGRIAPDVVLERARTTNPTLPDFTSDDIAALQVLNDSQRTLLQRLVTEGTSRESDILKLQDAQRELLKTTQTFQTLLDEQLLWIPSVPAIGLDWAPKIVEGFKELFSPKNLRIVTATFVKQVSSLWPLLLLLATFIGTLVRLRSDLLENIRMRATKVGRVKEDNLWHTPAVIVTGVLVALPIPLLFIGLGFIFASVEVQPPIINGLENACFFLAIFALVFLTWRVWDRENSLFNAHFKMDKALRLSVNKNLRWFIPVVGLSSGLLAVTTDIKSTNIYEGLSLFIFIFTALALAVFSFKVVLSDQDDVQGDYSEESLFSRYRTLIAIFTVSIPLGIAALAAFGYYETADELLWRSFTSAVLLFLAYIVWGTIRRAIVVAQRQMRYRQAVERRDAVIKARKEKEAAEERGEAIKPPPLDTREIDVSTITRQSSQLLNTIILISVAALMWMNWSSLLPALTIFDSFQVWEYKTGALDEAGKAIIQPVTMWNVLQSLLIVVLTFIAAKNLPGFLEIFVLNKLGVNPGTRYAIVTILGYIIVAAGVIVGFDRLGLQWGQLKFVAAGLSVGIGFGLQKIIANFVSGLIILFERPVRIGDYVTIGDQSGTVSRIKIRATTLADLDNREILIPNEFLISERVTNWTLSNSVTRLIVRVGIAYGSDTELARDLMLEKVKSLPKVLDTPPPQVIFMGFGDSSLDFEIRVFLRTFDDRVPMIHLIHTEVNKTLAEAGITIPFPQRDLNIMTQEVPLQIAPSPRKAPARKPKSKS